MTHWRLVAFIGLSAWLPCVAHAQDNGPPVGGSATSTNQSGGVTAYSIGKVYISEAPKADQPGEKLARTLSVIRNSRMVQATASFALPVYTALVDLHTDVAPPQGSDVIYSVFAFADESDAPSDFQTVCSSKDGPVVGGAVASIRTGNAAGKTITRSLSKADVALLQPICDSLVKPRSFLRIKTGASEDEEQTVFDFLSRGTDMVMLILLPGSIQGRDIEALMARHYWSSALVMRYSRLPSIADFATDPDASADLTALGTTLTMQSPFVGRFLTHDGADAYPSEAVREFGPRIAELDSNWLKYLSASALTVGGIQRPLVLRGQPAKVLPRFNSQDLATAAFWRSLPNYSLASEMISCIAGRFLEDQYGASTTEADLGRCATNETSWRQR